MNQKNIHWYPGHMKKAFQELETKLKVIDVVIEICDARAPISSRNPFLKEILKGKKKILVLSKKDFVEPSALLPYIKEYEKEGFVLPMNIFYKEDVLLLKHRIEEIASEKREKEKRKGIKPQPIRVMVVGIPNVGKSSLINALVGKESAAKANKPGFTKAQQWVKSLKGFDLLDTPGVLPPHYEDKKTALHLALIGAIPEEILPVEELFDALVTRLMPRYKKEIAERFHLKEEEINCTNLKEKIAQSRGFLLKEGKYDIEHAERVFLKEFKEGKIALVIVDSLC